MATITHDVADLGLAAEGQRLIDWSAQEMPVLRLIRDRFARERPLDGLRVGGCLHVTTETANLVLTLKAGGADVRLCASNPLSTQDAVAAALVVDHGVPVFAVKGEDSASYYSHIASVLEFGPSLTMDDGADLVAQLHKERQDLIPGVLAGTEETTTGVIRLRAMARAGALRFPIVAVNEALTKHMFDNRYGTGQSTLDGLIRATNVLLAGKTLVVCGYGWCGRGLAMRAAGLGAHVVVTEVDPVRALEAVMDGYRVAPLEEVAPRADIVICSTESPRPILTLAEVQRAVARRERPLVVIDIAVPRDVEPDVRGLPGVILRDIDDLERVAQANLSGRLREARHAVAQAAGQRDGRQAAGRSTGSPSHLRTPARTGTRSSARPCPACARAG